MTDTDKGAKQTNRERGGRSRRTREEMRTNGCTPDGIVLIEALDELIDARFDSRQKFLDAVAERNPRAEVVSVKTLSAQMGGGGRYAQGPTWKVMRLIVEHCSPEGRWVLELARIAGLWAQAHNEPRPPGYDGPIFPAVTQSEPIKHLEALMDGFPPSTEDPVHRPHTLLRWLLRTLVIAITPWIVAWVVFDADVSLDAFSGEQGIRPKSDAEWWGAGLVLTTVLIIIARVVMESRWHIKLRPGMQVISPPMEVGGITFTHLRPLRTGTEPSRRGHLMHELTWSLSPGAAIITPLAVRSSWGFVLSLPFVVRRVSGCLHGELEIAANPDAKDLPLVEWALVDDDGHLCATGLLPTPVRQAQAYKVLLPGQQRMFGLPLYSGDFSKSKLTDDDVAKWSWPDLNFAQLTGTVRWPPHYQINIILRRLDARPDTVNVMWTQAGIHLHRTSPYR